MASETLLPTATLVGSHLANIDEGVDTHDGGTTVVALYDSGDTLQITDFQSPTISGPVTDITIRFAALVYGLGGESLYASVGGITSGPSGTVALTNTFAIYELSASGSWTVSELENATAGFSRDTTANYIWISAVELLITGENNPVDPPSTDSPYAIFLRRPPPRYPEPFHRARRVAFFATGEEVTDPPEPITAFPPFRHGRRGLVAEEDRERINRKWLSRRTLLSFTEPFWCVCAMDAIQDGMAMASIACEC